MTPIILALSLLWQAHDYAHPDRTDWYMSLRSPGGGPCCDGAEANHVSDVDWDTTCERNNFGEQHCHYRVFLHGKWVDVPQQSVVQGPNRDGGALVWEVPTFNGNALFSTYIRCFMPGAGG